MIDLGLCHSSIAQYNDTGETVPKWAASTMRNVLRKRLTIRGFIVSDFASRQEDFLRDMSQWVREGKVKHREFFTEGLENAPTAVPAPAALLCAARRPYPPGPAGSRQSRAAQEPVPRRTRRPHDHGIRGAHLACGGGMGALCGSLRL
jgi:hypothetical protein